MGENPWKKLKSSPWVLMVGSGSMRGDLAETRIFHGRKVDIYARVAAIWKLKMLLDHLVKGPRVYMGMGLRDNYFDNRTAEKVKIFQRAHGLVADGIVGKNTMAVLFDLGERDPVVRKFERGIATDMWHYLIWEKLALEKMHASYAPSHGLHMLPIRVD